MLQRYTLNVTIDGTIGTEFSTGEEQLQAALKVVQHRIDANQSSGILRNTNGSVIGSYGWSVDDDE